MERCWSYSPENRPTFKECLSTLLMLEETISALPALAVHNVHYIGSNGEWFARFSLCDTNMLCILRDLFMVDAVK